MITYFKRTLRDEKLKKLKEFEVGSWINVVNPSDKELRYLVKEFGLDKQNLISGVDKNEIPRIDFVDDDVYVFLKIILPSSEKELDTFLITITDKFFLTLSKHEPKFMDDITEERLEFVTTQRLKCVIRLFSLINKEFENTTMNIVKIVNSKKTLTTELREKDVNALLEYEDVLNHFVSSYYHMNLIYERIIKKMKFFEVDKEIIEDLMVEANQGFNLCNSSLKTISNIRNYYMMLLSNKLNRVITILTVFTIFISIPAAISGLYGMNVILPLQNNPLAFYYILPFIGIIWIVFILYFKKKGIL